MNIEEAIKILNELKDNKWGELLNCWDYGAEESKAIETLLIAYEKEKEKNKEYKDMIIRHKKQLKQSGIYGYDYDLKISEEEQNNE